MPRLRDILDESDRRMKGGAKPPKPSKPPNVSRHPAYQEEENRRKKLKKKKEYDDWLHH